VRGWQPLHVCLHKVNRFFENVVKFKYLGKTITNPNKAGNEIKGGLQSCKILAGTPQGKTAYDT
jgi:hypothetical protein